MGKTKFYAKRSDNGKSSKLFTINQGKNDITVTFSADDGTGKQDIFNYVVKASSTPSPTNKPPVAKIATQNEADPGELLALDGSGSSDSDGTIATYLWSGDSSIVEPNLSKTSFTFPPDKDSVDIKLTVTDNLGATGTATATVIKKGTTPAPGPVTGLPVDITKGTVLFDSNVVWNDGHDRTMTGHHEFDKYDSKTEVAAGGHGTPRVWHVSGQGWSELSGGMSRVYNHSPHQGTVVILQTFIFNGTLDNMSYEWFSRHNEGGAPENRTGGDQNHFALTERGAKHESYHASYHTEVNDGPYPNGRKIKVGDEVRVAIVGTKDGTNYKSQAFIDWDHNGHYEQVMSADYTEKETPAGCTPQPLYWRWRVNGSAPKNVRVWDTKFIQM